MHLHALQQRDAIDKRNTAQAQPQRVYRDTAAPLPSVVANLGYLKPGKERPYEYAFEPPAGAPWQNCEYDARAMRVTDARSLLAAPSVHKEGFELRDAPSDVRDFTDEEAIATVYYEEMADLACRVTGGTRAYVFDHLVRKREAGRPALSFGRRGKHQQPSSNGRVHNDYTEESGAKRLRLVTKDADAAASAGHYSIVNIWRSIAGPIVDTPLGVIDSRTVSAADLVAGEVRYPGRTGEIYLLTHSARHRWFYYSAMDRNEALVFKQFDSQVDGVARFTPHAAFDIPDAPAAAPLRESIELRCLVVYE